MPRRSWKKYIGLAGILFLFPLSWLLFFGVFGKHNFNTLPYYGPDSKKGVDYTDYTLPPFAFINQEGHSFTLDSLNGKVWLAAFFSPNDPHLDRITKLLLELNWRYRDEPDIAIICFCTDCENYPPQLMKDYIDRNTGYNSFPGKWQFLAGDREAMRGYIRNGFLVEDLSSEAIFRLVDYKGHIRGLYGNTEYHIQDATEDIALLKKEIDRFNYNERKKQEKNR